LALLRSGRGIFLGTAIGRAWQANRFRSAYLRNTLWERGYAVDTLETAVSWLQVDKTVQDIEGALIDAAAQFNERILAFTHLSHVYSGGSSIYTTFVFRLADTPEKNMKRWELLKHAASTAVIRNGGTISHQHGVGTDHRRYLTPEKGAIGIEALRRLMVYFDPEQMFNPGKLLPAQPPAGDNEALPSEAPG
jgi:alkyldihydroxyacetonephosphate synthase